MPLNESKYSFMNNINISQDPQGIRPSSSYLEAEILVQKPH